MTHEYLGCLLKVEVIYQDNFIIICIYSHLDARAPATTMFSLAFCQRLL